MQMLQNFAASFSENEEWKPQFIYRTYCSIGRTRDRKFPVKPAKVIHPSKTENDKL